MPRKDAMTAGRRVVLQLVLVGVLMATTGLAALTIRMVESAAGVNLAPPAEVATLRLRLPEGWEHRAEVTPHLALILARSPRGQAPRREVQIYHYANPQGLPPEEFLARTDILHPDYLRLPRDGTAQLRRAGSAEIAGTTGMLLEGLRRLPRGLVEGPLHEVFIAAEVDGQLLVLRLQSADVDEAHGTRLLARRIAESIEIVRGVGE